MHDDRSGPRPGRARSGLVALVVGLVAIVAAALQLASAGYGTQPQYDFAQRRSYDMVKRDVQRVMPWTVLQGVAGLGLMMWGAHQRARRD